MNPKAAYHDGKVCIPVFAFTDGTGEALFNTLELDPDKVGELPIGDKTAQLELFRVSDNTVIDVEDVLKRADAAVLLVRFLDHATMLRVKELYHVLHSEVFLPKSIAIYREPKESEFKISCTYCGQKLWVRDRDAGRRGNCPQCRKTFFVPTQKSYITSYLMLTEEVPVLTLTGGDVSCRNAVASLVERIVNMEQSVKSSTMRIELPPEEPGS